NSSPPTRTFEYTFNGWLDHVIDPTGTQIDYLYDDVGNRIERRSALTAGAAPTGCGSVSTATCVRQTWAYGDLGRPIERTDAAGRTTTTSYDAAGRISATADPSGRTETYSYGVNGYGPTHSIVYGDGATDFTVTHQMDLLGRRTSLTDPTGTT